MADEDQGFVIRDKRGRGAEPESSAASKPVAEDAPRANAPAQSSPSQSEDSGPPLSFSSFVFSLGTSALMLMGEQIDPSQPKSEVNLVQAKEIVDILSILEEKTKGNLTSEEQGVLKELLYALRIKYVDLSSGKSVSPAS